MGCCLFFPLRIRLFLIICYICFVKSFILVLSFLLSLFFGGKEGNSSAVSSREGSCNVAAAPSSDKPSDLTQNREICIAAAQGYTFAGSENSYTVSVRTTNTGRRTSPQTKSTFRIVKGGKVIDNNHLHPFLALSFVQLSGLHISERYLFALCRLRL